MHLLLDLRTPETHTPCKQGLQMQLRGQGSIAHRWYGLHLGCSQQRKDCKIPAVTQVGHDQVGTLCILLLHLQLHEYQVHMQRKMTCCPACACRLGMAANHFWLSSLLHHLGTLCILLLQVQLHGQGSIAHRWYWLRLGCSQQRKDCKIPVVTQVGHDQVGTLCILLLHLQLHECQVHMQHKMTYCPACACRLGMADNHFWLSSLLHHLGTLCILLLQVRLLECQVHMQCRLTCQMHWPLLLGCSYLIECWQMIFGTCQLSSCYMQFAQICFETCLGDTFRTLFHPQAGTLLFLAHTACIR